MKRMKFALLPALLLLFGTACGRTAETDGTPVSHASFPIGGDSTYCAAGDRTYSLYYGFHIYDAEGETVGRGLCRDPLCEHKTASCPDYLLRRNTNFAGIATDGEILYVSALTFETDPKTG